MTTLPPEVTSALLHTGPGNSSLSAAGVAWRRMADQLGAAAVDVRRIAARIPWNGPAAEQMRAAVTTHAARLDQLAANATTAHTATRAAAAAYVTAHATITTPAAITRNRTLTAHLAALNVLGQYSAAIALLDAAYEQMWSHNATVMHTYATQATAATAALTPPDGDPLTPGSQHDTTGLAGLLNALDNPNTALGVFLNSNATSYLRSGAPISEIESGISNVGQLSFLTAFMAHQAAMQEIVTHATAPTITITPPPTPIPEPPRITINAGERIGMLRVPPTWAQQANVPPAARTLIATTPTTTTPPTPLPLPISNLGSLNRTEQLQRQPRYGTEPTVIPKHPAGG